MNKRIPEADPARPPADAREWRLQERAMHEARTGARAETADRELAAYRHIAEALRTPPAERLPSNFAFHVAQLAARLPKASRLDLRLEQWLVRGLLAAMVLGGLVVAVLYGASWLRTLQATGHGAGGWAATVTACLLLTWGMQGWRALRRADASKHER